MQIGFYITKDGWLFIKPVTNHLVRLLRFDILPGHEGKAVHENQGEMLLPPSKFVLLIPGNLVLELEFDGILVIDCRTRKVFYGSSV